MEEFKGTKGSWIVLDLDDIFIKSENGQQVLRIESNGFNPNAQANANLISAAPDLLEALQGLIKTISLGFQNEFTQLAKEAISKALGND